MATQQNTNLTLRLEDLENAEKLAGVIRNRRVGVFVITEVRSPGTISPRIRQFLDSVGLEIVFSLADNRYQGVAFCFASWYVPVKVWYSFNDVDEIKTQSSLPTMPPAYEGREIVVEYEYNLDDGSVVKERLAGIYAPYNNGGPEQVARRAYMEKSVNGLIATCERDGVSLRMLGDFNHIYDYGQDAAVFVLGAGAPRAMSTEEKTKFLQGNSLVVHKNLEYAVQLHEERRLMDIVQLIEQRDLGRGFKGVRTSKLTSTGTFPGPIRVSLRIDFLLVNLYYLALFAKGFAVEEVSVHPDMLGSDHAIVIFRERVPKLPSSVAQRSKKERQAQDLFSQMSAITDRRQVRSAVQLKELKSLQVKAVDLVLQSVSSGFDELRGVKQELLNLYSGSCESWGLHETSIGCVVTVIEIGPFCSDLEHCDAPVEILHLGTGSSDVEHEAVLNQNSTPVGPVCRLYKLLRMIDVVDFRFFTQERISQTDGFEFVKLPAGTTFFIFDANYVRVQVLMGRCLVYDAQRVDGIMGPAKGVL